MSGKQAKVMRAMGREKAVQFVREEYSHQRQFQQAATADIARHAAQLRMLADELAILQAQWNASRRPWWRKLASWARQAWAARRAVSTSAKTGAPGGPATEAIRTALANVQLPQ